MKTKMGSHSFFIVSPVGVSQVYNGSVDEGPLAKALYTLGLPTPAELKYQLVSWFSPQRVSLRLRHHISRKVLAFGPQYAART
eukprot:973088-Amphidinium_carterae.1